MAVKGTVCILRLREIVFGGYAVVVLLTGDAILAKERYDAAKKKGQIQDNCVNFY